MNAPPESFEAHLACLRQAKLTAASAGTTRVLLRAYTLIINAEVLVSQVDADAERNLEEYGDRLMEIAARYQDESGSNDG